MSDDVIAHFEAALVGPAGVHTASEVIVTRTRITAGSSTLSLAGATRASWGISDRRDARMFWLGWALVAAGIPFLGSFGVIGIALGLFLVWENRARGFLVGNVFLHVGDRRELAYSDIVGSTEHDVWAKNGGGSNEKWINERIEESRLRIERVREVAEALGRALGQGASRE